MYTKKSQIKMGETIAVLIVFFILIMVGLVIYSNMKSSKIEEKKEEARQLKSQEIVSAVSQLPEIKCSNSMCTGCSNGYDIIKLDKFATDGGNNDPDYNDGIISNEMPHYTPIFGYSSVSIRVFYPDYEWDSSNNEWTDAPEGYKKTWKIYERNKPNAKESPVFTFINIYNPYTEECYFGILNVTLYE